MHTSKRMSIYTVNDSQGHCVGIFDDLDKAKAYLLGWAKSICDHPLLVEPNNLKGTNNPSTVLYYVSDGGYRFLLKGHTTTHNVAEYTIEQWHTINEGW